MLVSISLPVSSRNASAYSCLVVRLFLAELFSFFGLIVESVAMLSYLRLDEHIFMSELLFSSDA